MFLEAIIFGGRDEAPQNQLSKLVLQTHDLLEGLILESEYREVFYPGAQIPMLEAWDSVSIRFKSYAEQVRNADVAVLEHHGMAAAELRFKLFAINFHAERFFTSFPEAPLWERRWLVSKLLEIIDKVLRSLIDAVPGGGAITEFKDICESLVSDEGVRLRFVRD